MSKKITCSLDELIECDYDDRKKIVLTPKTKKTLERTGILYEDLLIRDQSSFNGPKMTDDLRKLKLEQYEECRTGFITLAKSEYAYITSESNIEAERPLNEAERKLVLEVERSEKISTRQQKALEQKLRQKIMKLKQEEESNNYNLKKLLEKEEKRKQLEVSNKDTNSRKKEREDEQYKAEKAQLMEIQEQHKIQYELLSQQLRELDHPKNLKHSKKLDLQKSIMSSDNDLKQSVLVRHALEKSVIIEKDRYLKEKDQKEREIVEQRKKEKLEEVEKKRKLNQSLRSSVINNNQQILQSKRKYFESKIEDEDKTIDTHLKEIEESEKSRILKIKQKENEHIKEVCETARKNEEKLKESASIQLTNELTKSVYVQKEYIQKRDHRIAAYNIKKERTLKNVERVKRAEEKLKLDKQRKLEEDQKRTEGANKQLQEIMIDRQVSNVKLTLTNQRAAKALEDLSRTGKWKKAPNTLNAILSKSTNSKNGGRRKFLEVSGNLADVLT